MLSSQIINELKKTEFPFDWYLYREGPNLTQIIKECENKFRQIIKNSDTSPEDMAAELWLELNASKLNKPE